MNWNHFSQALGAAYGFYYLLNIAWDLLAGLNNTPKKGAGYRELFHPDGELPRQITVADLSMHGEDQLSIDKPLSGTPTAMNASTGGISMDSLVDQAKADLGEYTRDIPY